MNTIRTFIAALLLTAGCLSDVRADDYQFLTVSQSDGEASFEVSSISKITFDATDMILHLQDGTTQALPLSGLSRMFFTAEPAAVDDVQATQSKIRFADGMLRATVAPGEHIAVYDMKGSLVFSAAETGVYDMTAFRKGVYIIRVGKETRKVVNR